MRGAFIDDQVIIIGLTIAREVVRVRAVREPAFLLMVDRGTDKIFQPADFSGSSSRQRLLSCRRFKQEINGGGYER